MDIALNPGQTRHEAQMYKGTNEVISTVCIFRRRSGALARTQPAAEGKEVLRPRSRDVV